MAIFSVGVCHFKIEMLHGTEGVRLGTMPSVLVDSALRGLSGSACQPLKDAGLRGLILGLSFSIIFHLFHLSAIPEELTYRDMETCTGRKVPLERPGCPF